MADAQRTEHPTVHHSRVFGGRRRTRAYEGRKMGRNGRKMGGHIGAPTNGKLLLGLVVAFIVAGIAFGLTYI